MCSALWLNSKTSGFICSGQKLLWRPMMNHLEGPIVARRFRDTYRRQQSHPQKTNPSLLANYGPYKQMNFLRTTYNLKNGFTYPILLHSPTLSHWACTVLLFISFLCNYVLQELFCGPWLHPKALHHTAGKYANAPWDKPAHFGNAMIFYHQWCY